MPLMKCTNNGVSGWKYGESGHCYTGPGAKKKAIKQGQAIEISKHKKGKSQTLGEKIIESLKKIIKGK